MSWTGLAICIRKMRLPKNFYSEYLKEDMVNDKAMILKHVLKENLENCGIHPDGRSHEPVAGCCQQFNKILKYHKRQGNSSLVQILLTSDQ
jgi:hypothetical protein